MTRRTFEMEEATVASVHAGLRDGTLTCGELVADIHQLLALSREDRLALRQALSEGLRVGSSGRPQLKAAPLPLQVGLDRLSRACVHHRCKRHRVSPARWPEQAA